MPAAGSVPGEDPRRLHAVDVAHLPLPAVVLAHHELGGRREEAERDLGQWQDQRIPAAAIHLLQPFQRDGRWARWVGALVSLVPVAHHRPLEPRHQPRHVRLVALLRARDDQPVPRPRRRHVQQPRLLGRLLELEPLDDPLGARARAILLGPQDRALLPVDPVGVPGLGVDLRRAVDEEHHRPLQPLGPVDGRHCDHVIGGAVERRLGQPRVLVVPALPDVEEGPEWLFPMLLGDADERLQVRQRLPVLAHDHEVEPVAGAVEEILDQLVERQPGGEARAVVQDVESGAQRLPLDFDEVRVVTRVPPLVLERLPCLVEQRAVPPFQRDAGDDLVPQPHEG